jgi:hypothetical protein
MGYLQARREDVCSRQVRPSLRPTAQTVIVYRKMSITPSTLRLSALLAHRLMLLLVLVQILFTMVNTSHNK